MRALLVGCERINRHNFQPRDPTIENRARASFETCDNVDDAILGIRVSK